MWTRKQPGCCWFWVLLHTQDTEEQTAVSGFPRARPLRPGVKLQPTLLVSCAPSRTPAERAIGHRTQCLLPGSERQRGPSCTYFFLSAGCSLLSTTPCSVLSCLLWQHTEASELISQHPHINRSHSSGSIRRRGFHWFQIQLYLGLLEEPQSR